MIVAVAMARDEADVLPWTLAQMLTQADHVIVADNGSVDGTRGIALQAAGRTGRVTVVEDHERGYYQARKMTDLGHCAGAMGATWVVPFDADEAWWLPPGLEVADADVLVARPFTYVPQPGDDPAQPDPIVRIRHRLPYPEPHPKVAYRYHPDAVLHMGNHGVDHPGGRAVQGGEVRHYQYRSLGQVARKVRQGVQAYDEAPELANFGSHWRDLAALPDDALARWWDAYVAQDVVPG